ncbi:MAG: hypothetical protein JWP85_2119 [Rhodoglobus sp.]|nr:hypothetical protein [Rhodoglobus sp.]
MIFAVVFCVITSAFILRGCRAGVFRWPQRRTWFDIAR